MWSPTAYVGGLIFNLYISIHGLRVEPDDIVDAIEGVGLISIHGLRVEPDQYIPYEGESTIISIHGLRVEPDILTIMSSFF